MKPTRRNTTMIALLALVGLSACGGYEAARHEAAPAGSPAAVQTAPATLDGGVGTVSAPGVVAARQRAALAARIPASVTELPFRQGQTVAEGDVVVRLDDSALRSALAAAEANSAAAESDLARTQNLLERGAATPREKDEAAARSAAARAGVAGARDSLTYTVLRAPFAGRIASRSVDVGDVVAPGMSLIEIEGATGLELRVSLEGAQVARIKPGDQLQARADGVDGPLTATIRSIAPAADPGTHRFDVRADLPSVPGLRSGVFVRLSMPAPDADPRILVPAAALFERGGLTGVFVVEDGRARVRWIATGERSDDTVEIRAGVSEGERVVLFPNGLSDGAPVTESR